jgi:hypothetical protein
VATGELIVSVDDDVYVEPEAISALCAAYERDQKRGVWRVVAGSVRWGSDWSAPIVMRPIGYGRKARPGESPSFLVGALFLYPRALALRLPWNERIITPDDRICSDDRFMGAVWRAKGVEMAFSPDARAVHDDEHNRYGVKTQAAHIYVNLFDALIANRQLGRAACYELLGFAAGAKAYLREPGSAAAYLAAWYRGHRALIRDWRHLNELRKRELPDPELEHA